MPPKRDNLPDDTRLIRHCREAGLLGRREDVS